MAGIVEINSNPTPHEVRVFGLLWLAFLGGVGALALWRPQGLVGAAVILSAAWIVSLALNAADRKLQLLGAALPLLFGGAGGAVLAGADRWAVAGACWGVAAAGALLAWLAPGTARLLYTGWMLAALPVGWTISHLVLGAVFYLVLTPIGIAMRLLGRDPMRRRFDRSASSYWIRRKPVTDPARHFRQY